MDNKCETPVYEQVCKGEMNSQTEYTIAPDGSVIEATAVSDPAALAEMIK